MNNKDYDDLSQGSKANRQGEELHKELLRIITAHEFILIHPQTTGRDAMTELPRHTGEMLFKGGRVFAEKHIICSDIYRMPERPNFVLFDRKWPEPLAVLARHQSSSGSANAKLPYDAETVEQNYPCPCLFVLEGPYMCGNPDVMRWAYQRAARSNGRLRHIFAGAYEFRQWMMAGCPFPVANDPLLL